MNRRQFFGMTAAAVFAAGLPALVLPDRTIFLPPRFGWQPYKLGDGYMRETQQYLINRDAYAWRYDAVGVDLFGEERQFHVDMSEPRPDIAKVVIADRFQIDGLIALRAGHGRQYRLAIPNCAESARYI